MTEQMGPLTSSELPIRRGDRLEMLFAGEQIVIEPLKGEALQTFRHEVLREVSALVGRATDLAKTWPVLGPGIDELSLLKLGAPGVVTDELIERSTVPERIVLLLGLFWQHGLGPLREAIDVNIVTKTHEFAALKAALRDEIQRQEIEQ
jgi:hypothetical protein